MSEFRVGRMVAALAAAVMLVACGGGSIGGDAEDPDDPTDPVPTSITLVPSATQLSSNASSTAQGITLVATVKDASNNVISNQTVVFSTADSGTIVVANPAITDSEGKVIARLTTGGDARNRSITVVATTDDISASVTIQVIGTTLDISGPENTQINTPTQYSILLTDSAGTGVSGQPVNVTTEPGNTLSAASLTTDASGQATVTLTPTVANSTITATALGLSATRAIAVSQDQFDIITPVTGTEINIGTSRAVTVRWLRSGAPVVGQVVNFAATRGTLSAASATTNANGIATVTLTSAEAGFSQLVASSPAPPQPSSTRTIEFVSVTPAAIDVQANPATIATNQSADITAIVRDASNNLVKNQTVAFSLQDSTNGNISAPTAVTNSQGLARITYTSSSQVSATEGVVVTARIPAFPAVPSDTAAITVGSRAVSITLGTGASLRSRDASSYAMPFTVVVTDSAGNPVQNAQFRLSVRPEEFYKGTFAGMVDVNDPGASLITCPSEDVNNNDIRDPSEDTDGDLVLDPGRVASVPATITLDEAGAGQFELVYPKDHGLFVTVELIGVVSAAGTEATARRDVLLDVTANDFPNLPGISPYGTVQNCANPN